MIPFKNKTNFHKTSIHKTSKKFIIAAITFLIIWLSVIGLIIYIAFHFISKFW